MCLNIKYDVHVVRANFTCKAIHTNKRVYTQNEKEKESVMKQGNILQGLLNIYGEAGREWVTVLLKESQSLNVYLYAGIWKKAFCSNKM